MHLLFDENVPNGLADVFRPRGHLVTFAREVAPAGSPDPLIAQIGDNLSAIVVTWNRSHFLKMLPLQDRRMMKRLGLMMFRCLEPQGARRATELIDLIEHEHCLCVQRNSRPQFSVEVGNNYFKVYR